MIMDEVIEVLNQQLNGAMSNVFTYRHYAKQLDECKEGTVSNKFWELAFGCLNVARKFKKGIELIKESSFN